MGIINDKVLNIQGEIQELSTREIAEKLGKWLFVAGRTANECIEMIELYLHAHYDYGRSTGFDQGYDMALEDNDDDGDAFTTGDDY
jgi:hypothetical protein